VNSVAGEIGRSWTETTTANYCP